RIGPVPGQGKRALRQLVLAGQVQVRREQGPPRHLAGRDQLRDGEDLDGSAGILRCKVGEGDGGVRGAEVDPDGVAQRHGYSPRTENSSFQAPPACFSSRANSSSASVPTSVTEARRPTGSTSPLDPSRAGSSASMAGSSSNSETSSTTVPGGSSRRARAATT